MPHVSIGKSPVVKEKSPDESGDMQMEILNPVVIVMP